MEPTVAAEVVRFLQAEKLDVLVIGDAAMEAQGFGATDDVGLLLTVEGFDQSVSLLERQPRVQRFVSVGKVTAGGWLVTERGRVKFDLLSACRFSGTRGGGALFQYLKARYSFHSTAGPTLRPAAVWYLRLVPGSETALSKILRDLRQHSPRSWRAGVLRIADHFGTRAQVLAGLERLDELGRLTRVRTRAGGTRA